MGIDIARYHGWHGELRWPWRGSLAIVRVGLLQVFRRKSYWVVILLGMLNFLLFWSIIYGVTQFQLPENEQRELLREFGFSAQPEDVMSSGYFEFMSRQSLIVMILLAFSGSLLVGSDFRLNAMPFYLSRRIDRAHYIAGKLLAVSAVVLILTVLPALALWVEYGMFTSSFDYWWESWNVPVAIMTYGAVLCAVLSVLLVTLSAYLQKMAPIAITWSSLFVMLASLAGQLENATDNLYWTLIDPWRDMRYVGKLIFGSGFDTLEHERVAWTALVILIVVCSVALALTFRRVRAVDVVE